MRDGPNTWPLVNDTGLAWGALRDLAALLGAGAMDAECKFTVVRRLDPLIDGVDLSERLDPELQALQVLRNLEAGA